MIKSLEVVGKIGSIIHWNFGENVFEISFKVKKLEKEKRTKEEIEKLRKSEAFVAGAEMEVDRILEKFLPQINTFEKDTNHSFSKMAGDRFNLEVTNRRVKLKCDSKSRFLYILSPFFLYICSNHHYSLSKEVII